LSLLKVIWDVPGDDAHDLSDSCAIVIEDTKPCHFGLSRYYI
jgi:hypothetical protein